MYRVPFTVVGGFLGSGKTTLLNHLLSQSSGVRYAVLVNDFGKLNIDESLISKHSGRTVSLVNGCVCCSIANDFIETMIDLVSRIQEFDQVVVEASGVSEPDRIMDIARIDPELVPNGIVVMVDAAEVKSHVDDPLISQVVRNQLRSADILVINKTDLINEELLEGLEKCLTGLSPTAVKLKTSWGIVPLPLIFGGKDELSYNRARLIRGVKPEVRSEAPFHAKHGPQLFRSIALQGKVPIDGEVFKKWSESLPDSVIRGKGTLRFLSNPDQVWIWQKVGLRSTFDLLKGGDPGNSLKAVLIGSEEMPSSRVLGVPGGMEEVRSEGSD